MVLCYVAFEINIYGYCNLSKAVTHYGSLALSAGVICKCCFLNLSRAHTADFFRKIFTFAIKVCGFKIERLWSFATKEKNPAVGTIV